VEYVELSTLGRAIFALLSFCVLLRFAAGLLEDSLFDGGWVLVDNSVLDVCLIGISAGLKFVSSVLEDFLGCELVSSMLEDFLGCKLVYSIFEAFLGCILGDSVTTKVGLFEFVSAGIFSVDFLSCRLGESAVTTKLVFGLVSVDVAFLGGCLGESVTILDLELIFSAADLSETAFLGCCLGESVTAKLVFELVSVDDAFLGGGLGESVTNKIGLFALSLCFFALPLTLDFDFDSVIKDLSVNFLCCDLGISVTVTKIGLFALSLKEDCSEPFDFGDN
jgi:hypothetical protein